MARMVQYADIPINASMRILAIETSCDETSVAIVDCSGGLRHPAFIVRNNLIASQIDIHRPWGGVVPNLAKREHLKNLPVLYETLFGAPNGPKELRLWATIDLVAVTVGPGLEPALWAGIEFAKSLAKKWKKPIAGTHHVEGHLYSFLLTKKASSSRTGFFPAVALTVSGGHTALVLLQSLARRTRLGETLDDAAGEAFDKVARLLSLPYPGGPEIERIAATASRAETDAIVFPRPMLDRKNYDFSFSGLKTAVLYYLKNNPRADRAVVAAAFQEAATDVLVKKTMRAAKEYHAHTVCLAGGVASNNALRLKLGGAATEAGRGFLVADRIYNTDNAAMIAVAAYRDHILKKRRRPLRARGDLPL